MWSPASPDLNPIDSLLWALLKTKVCSATHSSVNAFKTSLLCE